MVRTRFPRTRGDVPVMSSWKGSDSRFPPHTRGCTVDPALQKERPRVSPAHAGMYPRLVQFRCMREGFPRTRGDVPWWGDWEPGISTVSPAHAGMYRWER